jgi:hypothetical protein
MGLVVGKVTVSFLYDEITSQVQSQITRDLMALQDNWDIQVNEEGTDLDSLFDALGIPKVENAPELVILYRVKDWLPTPPGVTVFKRDLKPSILDTKVDPNPKIGYFLNPQGRDIAPITERYLNRVAPKARGVVDPQVLLLWG